MLIESHIETCYTNGHEFKSECGKPNAKTNFVPEMAACNGGCDQRGAVDRVVFDVLRTRLGFEHETVLFSRGTVLAQWALYWCFHCDGICDHRWNLHVGNTRQLALDVCIPSGT